MTIVVYTAPSEEPLTTAEAKLHCKMFDDITTDDTLIARLIKVARQEAEVELRRYLITQTLDAYFDSFPDKSYDPIMLPPLQSVTSITYVDSLGVSQTLATDQYTVDAKSIPARIVPAYGLSWPSCRGHANDVVVRFVGGYGAAAAVPDCIKAWMLLRIKTLYDGRDQLMTAQGLTVVVPALVDGLLDPERVTGRI